ncbi:ribonuclease H-like domain-containing protein [Tanacetum coccineum]
MSETEPIPPTSSVTALRIPIIKKGEYDLWSMKMRQYIAITDHILWDIITNGNQTTTDPASPSVSAPKTSLAANARRNNEKALNILLSAIPDRHLLSFHDAVDARSLWKAIKARFGGNEASKKMQKNLLKQQFETFTIGSREELDSAYESTYPKKDILKHLEQGATAPNCVSHSDEIICSFFAQQASMPTTHDDEDLLQIDEDAMEEIDIRWQVAMITARIRKFMRKTGRSIDLKPKNGITFDKSKIECFNCQKLGHFARECRFAKYQENKANGRNEKRIVAIEDSNSKALVATDNNEDIDWTKEFDAEPVTYAMMALTGFEQDDWSIEFDAEHMHFGQDGLDDFDWSNKADDAPISLALMATNSEVPYCSKCSKSYKLLLENYQKERDNFQRARTEILGYQMSLESLEVMLKTHEKNEYAWGDNDDEETDVSESQKETAFNSENSETSFENSPNHLIKDCNLHERTFKHTQTHKPKGTQGSRETRPVWNNIQRVNHSNFARNSRYPHQRRSFIPSAVLTRDGLISTARPKMTQTVPSKSTANVTYQGTARSRVPQAVLSRSTDGSYYPRMDNRRPRISSYSPSSRSSTTRTPHRPQRPKKVVKLIWVKKGSTVGSQAVLPQTVKKSAMISPEQTWKPKGNYLDSVNRGNGSYTLKQFEYGNPEEDLKDYALSLTVAPEHNVLFTDKECLILSPKFKFVDEDLVILRAPRKNDVYSLDLKKLFPLVGITLFRCKATEDEAVLLHRSPGAIQLQKYQQLGKQHRASCKKIEERTVREPLELLHMDLFGPVFSREYKQEKVLLVVTDDVQQFSWVNFLAYKEEDIR